MAIYNGQQIQEKAAQHVGGNSRLYAALVGAGATTNGSWMDGKEFPIGSLEVFGTFSATVQLRGSNALDQPDDAIDGAQIGSDITAAAVVAITVPCRWYKVKCSAWASGSVKALLHLVR